MSAAGPGDPIRKDYENWWPTKSEKNFLDGLGYFTILARSNRLSPEDLELRRYHLLLNYQAAIPLRKVWDLINRKKIEVYVQRVIDRWVKREEEKNKEKGEEELCQTK